MLKTCVICGKPFDAYSSRSKVCGDECRLLLRSQYNAAYHSRHKPDKPLERRKTEPPKKTIPPRICAHCGRQFIPSKYCAAQKYCSDKCRMEHNKPRQNEYYRDRYRRRCIEAAAKEAEAKKASEQLDATVRAADEAGLTYGQYIHRQQQEEARPAPTNTPAGSVTKLKGYLKQVRTLLGNVADGKRSFDALADLDRLKSCIANEALLLYVSGDLDRLEEMLYPEKKESHP